MVAIVLPRAATPGTTPEVAEPDWRDESTCSCVGGPGREGCRVAEPMRDVARRFRRRHPGFDPTTVADAELFDILRPYVLEELGTGDLRTSLDRSAMVCLASQIAGQVRPLPVASAFRDRLRRSIVGREEGTPA